VGGFDRIRAGLTGNGAGSGGHLGHSDGRREADGGSLMATTAETNAPRSGRDFAEAFLPENDVLRVARGLAADASLTPISPSTGATLCMLAAATSARAAIEIGTGTGVGALWLLRGMRTDGVLTTIDIDAEHQRMARRIFAEAGHAASRTRLITGQALDVLPRLADGAYDLLFLDGDRADYAACVAEAPRLLRAGGILALNGALAGGRVADPAIRDPETVALRDLVRSFRDNDDWRPALLPIGDGLLCAVRV
jgi:predicted O-methyltransferase YrrM